MPTQAADTLAQQVRELVSKQADIPQDQVLLDSTFHGDLGFDSLEDVEFIMAVEEQFHIEISDETATKIQTVGQAIDEIEQAIARKAAPEQTTGA